MPGTEDGKEDDSCDPLEFQTSVTHKFNTKKKVLERSMGMNWLPNYCGPRLKNCTFCAEFNLLKSLTVPKTSEKFQVLHC